MSIVGLLLLRCTEPCGRQMDGRLLQEPCEVSFQLTTLYATEDGQEKERFHIFSQPSRLYRCARVAVHLVRITTTSCASRLNSLNNTKTTMLICAAR